jgi:hypothetical protein
LEYPATTSSIQHSAPYASISSVTRNSHRSAAVTAAAIVAIIGSASATIVWVWFLYTLSRVVRPNGESVLASFSLFIVLIAVIPPVLALLGFQTGIGLLRLHPWSRKSALVWALVSLLFCGVLMVRYPYEIFSIDNQHFIPDFAILKQFFVQSILILLFPTSIWWLVLFTRKSVKAKFTQPAAPDSGVSS